MTGILGRTNRAWSAEWWRLVGIDGREATVESLRESPRPIFVPGSPAIWANDLRGFECEWIVVGSAGAESAWSEEEAAGRIMGEVVQRVSCSPDGHVSVWFLSVDRAWEEFQTNGALRGLEAAREEGLVDYLGLHVAGRALASAGMWRFHDAFELVMVAPGAEFESVRATAEDRRVGVVQDGGDPLGFGPVLKTVEVGV